jgi:hypothetical protein
MNNTPVLSEATPDTRCFLMEVGTVAQRVQRFDQIGGLVVEGNTKAEHRQKPATRIQLASAGDEISNVARLVINDGIPITVERQFEIPLAALPANLDTMEEDEKNRVLVAVARTLTTDTVFNWVQDL